MNSRGITITQTLTPTQKQQAAQLYFEAFGQKLIHLLGISEDPAISAALLEESLQYQFGYFAVQNGEVLGGIALVTGKDHFDHMTYHALRRYFPCLGAAIRHLGYRIYEAFDIHPAKDEVLIEALFVGSASRGMGVGTELLNFAEDYAHRIKRDKLILGVIDTNQGAKRLYERQGFKVYRYEKTGLFTSSAGFTGSYRMRKVLD